VSPSATRAGLVVARSVTLDQPRPAASNAQLAITLSESEGVAAQVFKHFNTGKADEKRKQRNSCPYQEPTPFHSDSQEFAMSLLSGLTVI
jgi:hypothetical protein